MKEWYLLTPETRPNMTGGYENDYFQDWKEDAFFEVLGTELASTVTIYDSHMQKIKDTRLIVQNNLANTMLNSVGREILAPVGTLKAGMYLGFEDCYWLVVGYPGNNKAYEKAVVKLCQSKVKWQKADGTIVERWANFTTASKYDVGKYSNNYITISSNNFSLLVPDDEDGATLEGKRIFIDREQVNPEKVFHITRSDDVLYLYGEHGGILSFIADRTELNMEMDRPDLGLCDYIEPAPLSPPVEQPKILGSDTLKLGNKTVYSAIGLSDAEVRWNLISTFPIENKSLNKDICLRISDYKMIGKSFTLQLIVKDAVVCEKHITVRPAF